MGVLWGASPLIRTPKHLCGGRGVAVTTLTVMCMYMPPASRSFFDVGLPATGSDMTPLGAYALRSPHRPQVQRNSRTRGDQAPRAEVKSWMRVPPGQGCSICVSSLQQSHPGRRSNIGADRTHDRVHGSPSVRRRLPSAWGWYLTSV